MPYVIGEEIFASKGAITNRCREIIAATGDGQPVDTESASFLLALFQFHDELHQKSGTGIRRISTRTTPHGTRCFILVMDSGETMDISFPHAIRLIPSSHASELLPQALRDFRNAARMAVRAQIYEFRDKAFLKASICPYTGETLNRENYAVDHTPPQTFDSILFDFCKSHGIDPLQVVVGSEGGTVAVFADQNLGLSWQEYHRTNACLRLLSQRANLSLQKKSVAWSELFGNR